MYSKSDDAVRRLALRRLRLAPECNVLAALAESKALILKGLLII